MKKLLLICLVIVALTNIFALVACNNISNTSGNYIYSVSNGKATITSIEYPTAEKLIIPAVLDGYPVISIDEFAFSGCESLVEITIPDSVISVDENALSYIELENINVSENNLNFSSLDGVLFNKDKTKLIHYPNGKTNSSYTIPNSVTSIGNNAFFCIELENINASENNSSFSSVDGVLFNKNKTTLVRYPCGKTNTNYTLPDSVSTICEGALSYIELENINVSENNLNFSSLDGVLFNKDKTVLIWYPSEKKHTSYVIPDGVKMIGDEAFESCNYNLQNITIPESVTHIGKYAFSFSFISSISIPNSVIEIGEGAFWFCTNLLYITIPSSVTRIGNRTFMDCTDLISIRIHKNITSIGEYAFEGCIGIKDVVYDGNTEEKSKILIETGNDCFINATWKLN